MKIEVEEDRTVVLKEVYSHFAMETSEGNRINICMRDDSFEISVVPKGNTERNWWRVDMSDGTIKSALEDPPLPPAMHNIDAEGELAKIMSDEPEVPQTAGDPNKPSGVPSREFAQTMAKLCISLDLEVIEYKGAAFTVLMENEIGKPKRFVEFAGTYGPEAVHQFPQEAAVQWLIHERHLATNLAIKIVSEHLGDAMTAPPPPPRTPNSKDRVKPRLLREDQPAPTNVLDPTPGWCPECGSMRDDNGYCDCPG